MLMARQDDDRGQQPILLLVDDDKIFCEVMSRALEKRGFRVIVSHDVAQALSTIEASPPEYAVVDLWLPDRSGLALVAKLKTVDPHTNVVVLTGHASIATAVEAIKLGATYYLTKPVDADNVVHAFNRRDGDESVPLSDKPLSVERMEWEHINRVLAEHHGNISAAARALSMYRRTLQRKLRKRAREY